MKTWYFLIATLFFFACKGEKNQTVSEEVISEIEATEIEDTSSKKPTEEGDLSNLNEKTIGFYVGEFKAEGYDNVKNITYFNKINISIDSLKGDQLYGHSVVAGNIRPFVGAYAITGTTIHTQVKEPGDDRYDGVFTFTLKPFEDNIFGYWSAYDSTLAVYKRKYQLKRMDYAYLPELNLPSNVKWEGLADHYPELDEIGEFLTEDVLSKNPSSERLTKEDVENMYRGDLEIMRNSIYARHGYSFKNRKVRFIFDRYVDWYIPVSTDIRTDLTELELANIDLIKRYEEHAEVYYDSYGR